MLTLAEYLVDYAPAETALKGWEVVERNMQQLNEMVGDEVRDRIERIKQGERDLYF